MATSSSIRLFLFWQKDKDNSQRVSRQERSWVGNLSIRHILFCCFIDITQTSFYCTLYLIQTELINQLTVNQLTLTEFTSVSYILCSTFYLQHVLMLLFFILSVDLKPQESEGLKWVYCLKFSLPIQGWKTLFYTMLCKF